MATHSSLLAWRILWTEEPGGLQSLEFNEPDTTERLTEAPGSVLGSGHTGESGWQSPCPPGAHLLLECCLSEQTGQSGGEARLAPLDCSHSPNTPGSFPLTCAFSSWVFCLMCCFPFLTLATSCHPSRIVPTVSSPLRFSLNMCTPTLGASCSLLAPSTLLLASVWASYLLPHLSPLPD